MCELLVEGVDGLSACALEIERDGPSYTVDTLEAIAASHADAELTFIVGADTARTLPTWREPRRLLELASLAVAARAGAESPGRARGHLRAGWTTRSVRFLDTPLLEVSSSWVRERAGAGEAVEELVGPAVAGYIAAHGLYRVRSKAGS